MSSDLSPCPHIPLRFVLTGAFGLVVLLLLFWGTSAANALPNKTPELVRMFTPAYGLVRLVIGLAAAAAVGALLALLCLGQTLEPVVPDAIDQGEKPFVRPFMIDIADDHYALDLARARQLLGWKSRPVLFLNAIFGLALLVTPFVFETGTAGLIASGVCGVALIALSLSRGTVHRAYGGWNRWIV